MQVYKVSDQCYDGSQLHHAFCYENGGPLGASIAYFCGPAEVKDHLVDIEDRLANDFIKSKDMWHFIIEIPGASIAETVLWQRLFITKCIDTLTTDSFEFNPGNVISRDGDDIMITTTIDPIRKLSVSIATLSRFSGLIHVGINIEVGEGCPVAAVGLNELLTEHGISIYGATVAHLFATEYDDIINATYKVNEVK